MELDWVQILIYFFDIAVAAGVFFGLIWFGRRHYTNLIMPSKKYPNGQVVCEFWSETGLRYYKLLPLEPNGMEVKAPKGHSMPRYFFSKEATNKTKWPLDQIFRTLGVAVDAPIVSWPENSPEPIVPTHMKPIATATLLGSIGDDDFLAFAMAANHEIAELQKALAKAMASGVSRMAYYIGAGLIVIVAAAGAYFAYNANIILEYIRQAWGI